MEAIQEMINTAAKIPNMIWRLRLSRSSAVSRYCFFVSVLLPAPILSKIRGLNSHSHKMTFSRSTKIIKKEEPVIIMILMFMNYEPVPAGGGGAWMAYPVLIHRLSSLQHFIIAWHPPP